MPKRPPAKIYPRHPDKPSRELVEDLIARGVLVEGYRLPV